MSASADEGFGAHPFGEIARATVAAQERSLELAQAWSGSLQQLVSDQAESGRAALEALTSTLAATEKALASQEEANRALRKRLEASRELTRAFLAPMTAQPEAFGSMVQGWNDAFLRLLEAAPGARPRRPEPPEPPR